ncbi:hypothetical protein [Nocardia farcinica]|uniref:hypothetical protein n=1 Tax=Nocardia farcinica TaxID=37329 RepID=UPI002454522C|nr:hypothetical protein [Nocardia farcinica]
MSAVTNRLEGPGAVTRHVLDIPLPRPPLTSNQQRGAHWSKVKAARDAVAWHIRSAGGDTLPRLDRCHVAVTWHAPDRRTRDAGSLHAFGKAAIDALVDLGVLAKDDADHVLSESYSVQQGSDHPRITITLTVEEERKCLSTHPATDRIE